MAFIVKYKSVFFTLISIILIQVFFRWHTLRVYLMYNFFVLNLSQHLHFLYYNLPVSRRF